MKRLEGEMGFWRMFCPLASPTHPGEQDTETRAGLILEITTRVSSALYFTRTYYRYSYYLESFMRPATSPGEGQARAKSKNDLTGEKQDTKRMTDIPTT